MHFRRFFNVLASLVLLAVVGVGSFCYVRFRPRCVIEGQVGLLSDDGNRFLTAKDDGQGATTPLQVWDTHSCQPLRMLMNDVGAVFDTAPGANGLLLAVGPGDDTLRLIDWQTGKEETLRVGSLEDTSVRFSPRGTWLDASVSEFHSIIHVPTGREVLRSNHKSVQFNTDEKLVFLRKLNEQITVWDLHAGKKLGTIPDGTLLTVPDGRTVLTLTQRVHRGLRPRTVETLEGWHLPSCVKQFERKYDCRDFCPPVIDPSGRAGAIWHNGRLQVVDVVTSRVVFEPMISPSSRHVAVWHDGRLEVLDIVSGRIVFERDCKATSWRDFSFSPDGELFFLAAERTIGLDTPCKLSMYETSSGRKIWEYDCDLRGGGWRPDETVVGRPGWIPRGFVRFVADGGVLLCQMSPSRKGKLELLDARTGQIRAAPGFTNLWPSKEDITPDGRHIITTHQLEPESPSFVKKWLKWIWPQNSEAAQRRTVVVEATTGRELFRRPSEGHAQVSADGSTLLFMPRNDGPARIEIWDLHPRRAWKWAAVNAFGAGLGIWLFRRGWRRWCRRRAVVALPPSVPHSIAA